VILSGSGADEVRGGSGDDLISLGRGPDWGRGGSDSDVLRGSRGHDFLNAEDKTRNNDIAFGGDAADRCLKDRRDYLDSCR
jgi:Ca2+-binding RTX toxin-like protein